MATITITNLEFFSMGNRRVANFRVNLPDENYTDGGYSLTPGHIRMTKIDIALIESKGGMLFEYDYTAEKFKAVYPRGEILSTQKAVLPPGETTVKSIAESGQELISLVGEAGVAPGKGDYVKGTANIVEVSPIRCMFIGY